MDPVLELEVSEKKIRFQCVCLLSEPYKRKMIAMGRESGIRSSRSVQSAKRRRTEENNEESENESRSTVVAVPLATGEGSDNDSDFQDAISSPSRIATNRASV